MLVNVVLKIWLSVFSHVFHNCLCLLYLICFFCLVVLSHYIANIYNDPQGQM